MVTPDFNLLDEDGYPTEEVLKFITEFNDLRSIDELFEFIRDNLWWHPDDPGKWVNSRHRRFLRYRMATGGWSGNESIIRSLRDNFMIWTLTWEASFSGGLHIFDIPENYCNKKENI